MIVLRDDGGDEPTSINHNSLWHILKVEAILNSLKIKRWMTYSVMNTSIIR